MKLSAALLTACLFALPVWAASSLDALRSGSRGAREQVTSLRAEQLKQRNELSTLSSRIETLKAASKGKLLPGGELDAALKRSQELSGALSELAQQVSGREAELETANLSLLDALSSELTRLRADFDRQTEGFAALALIVGGVLAIDPPFWRISPKMLEIVAKKQVFAKPAVLAVRIVT